MTFFLVMPGLLGGFEIILYLSLKGLQKWYILVINSFSYFDSCTFISFPNPFHTLRIWKCYRMNSFPPISTSFMTLSPSSTGNLMFGLSISEIYLHVLHLLIFGTTRSYYLTLDYPIVTLIFLDYGFPCLFVNIASRITSVHFFSY